VTPTTQTTPFSTFCIVFHIIPIIKDRLGDTNDVSNYRGITLSPVISKLFEYCAMKKYYNYFPNSDLKFGFKEKLGCSHAIFAL